MRLMLHEAVESILERDTPILMIDTCSLLDLIRATFRGETDDVVRGDTSSICENRRNLRIKSWIAREGARGHSRQTSTARD